jgi:hypothetical protein
MRKSPFPYKGVVGKARAGVMSFFATVTVGASGAISSQDKSEDTGMAQLVKNAAAGRYQLVLPERYKKFLKGVVTVIGPNTAAYNANNTVGLLYFFRANDIDGNNKDGTIELQFVNGSAYADADVPSGTIFIVELVVAEGV